MSSCPARASCVWAWSLGAPDKADRNPSRNNTVAWARIFNAWLRWPPADPSDPGEPTRATCRWTPADSPTRSFSRWNSVVRSNEAADARMSRSTAPCGAETWSWGRTMSRYDCWLGLDWDRGRASTTITITATTNPRMTNTGGRRRRKAIGADPSPRRSDQGWSGPIHERDHRRRRRSWARGDLNPHVLADTGT